MLKKNRYNKSADSLLERLVEEFGSSSFTRLDIDDSIASLTGQGHTQDLNNLLKRELIESIDEDQFEVTHEGHVYVEDAGEILSSFEDKDF